MVPQDCIVRTALSLQELFRRIKTLSPISAVCGTGLPGQSIFVTCHFPAQHQQTGRVAYPTIELAETLFAALFLYIIL